MNKTLTEKIEEIILTKMFVDGLNSSEYRKADAREATQSLLTLFQEEMEEAKKEGASSERENLLHTIRKAEVESEPRYLTNSGFWSKKRLVDQDKLIDSIKSPKPISKDKVYEK